jgi:hypothetical protein
MRHEQLLFAYTNVNAKCPYDIRHMHPKIFSCQSRIKSRANSCRLVVGHNASTLSVVYM